MLRSTPSSLPLTGSLASSLSSGPPRTSFPFGSGASLPPHLLQASAAAQLARPPSSTSTQQNARNEPDLRFLMHHATMGFSVPDYFAAQNLGWSAYLEQQLDPGSIDDAAVDSVLALLPTLPKSASELLTQYPDEQVETVLLELQFAVMLRAIYSKRQLYERMVAFWTDHFNISQLDDLCLWFKTVDDREVIRQHALGKFPDMLKASARSSAMVWYLDNYANTVGSAQENYARELLELHTLGVDGPYTENDVREVARCFTGWTLDGIVTSGPPGEFVFVPDLHDYGPKTVLGHGIPALGGIEDGEQVLDILANHPRTAEFISSKMCRWLLGYEPPVGLVRSVAQIYLQTGGDIKQMIRLILDPTVVVRIPVGRRTKLRQPLHYAVSLMRAGLIESSDLLQITIASQTLGQVPFFWPTPDGPPDSLEKWGSSVLPRWEYSSRLFGGQIPGNQPNPAMIQALMNSAPGGDVAARINWALTGGLLSVEDEAEVRAFLMAQPVVTDSVLGEAFALASSSPSYQFF